MDPAPADSLNATLAELARIFSPPPRLTVTEWADTKRQLSRESSASAGQWKSRPYQREPQDVFTDPTIHTIVYMVARQTLKTEAENNCLGFAIDQDPGPTMFVQFRDADVKKFSKIRLAPMLRDTPCLREKVKEGRGRSKSTHDFKEFAGGHLSIVASGSPGNLMALPIRYLFCDEVDKYPRSSGNAGDPIRLAQGRQEEFWNRKTVMASTPTVKNLSRIEQEWKESDQREYELKCPFCGTFQIPKWSQVVWDSSLPVLKAGKSARYKCINPDCEQLWNDAQRFKAINEGRYRATAPFTGIAGFRVSGIARLVTPLAKMVEEFIRSRDDDQKLKTFVNEQLAELWEEPGEVLDWQTLVERREGYPVGTVPKGGLFLTAGADVQRENGGRIEVTIYAWGENRESWGIDHRIFYGNPAEPEVWGKLESLLHETWPTESGAELPIERLMVDSGDGTITPHVYAWVQTQPRPRVWAIKGDRRREEPVGRPKEVEITSGGKKLKFGVLFKIVNSDFFKGLFYGDLKKRPPTPTERAAGLQYPQGFCHYPADDAVFGDEFFRQLTNEQLVTVKKRNGRESSEYVKLGRNETLDCRAYAMAGAWDYGAFRFQAKHWGALKQRVKELEPETAPTAPAPPAPETAADDPHQPPPPPRPAVQQRPRKLQFRLR